MSGQYTQGFDPTGELTTAEVSEAIRVYLKDHEPGKFHVKPNYYTEAMLEIIRQLWEPAKVEILHGTHGCWKDFDDWAKMIEPFDPTLASEMMGAYNEMCR